MSNLLSVTQLINSLSKSEKRSFTQYAALQEREKSYLDLYTLIRKGQSKDVACDFNRLNPESDFGATIQYLWSILTKTLLSMRSDQTDEEKLLYGMLEIKLLFRKGLIDEAFKLLAKYKFLARKSEKYDYCMMFEKLELQNQSNHQFESMPEEADLVSLQSQYRRNIQVELNLADHSALYELLYFRYLKKGNVLSDKDKENLNDLVVTEMNLAGSQRFESFDLNRNHLLFQSVYFMMTGDHRSGLRTFLELDKLFEKYAHLWNDSPRVYINHLCGILNSLFNAQQIHEMDYFINKLRAIRKISPPILIDQAICVAELKKTLVLREFECGISLIDRDFAHLFSSSNSPVSTDRAELHLFAGLVCFHSKQHKKAAGLLRKIIYLEPTKNSWLWKMIKWLNLLVNLELNDFDYLMNESGSVERLLKKQVIFYPADKILMRYVKRFPSCMNKRAKVLLATECLNELNILEKNQYELQFLNTMSIQFWLSQKKL